MTPQESKPQKAQSVLAAYAKASIRHPWILSLVFLGGLITEFAGIITPLYMRDFIDTLSVGARSQEVVQQLFGILSLFALVAAVGWVGRRIQAISLNTIESKVMTHLSNQAFRNLLTHSYDFFVSNFTGGLTRRVTRYSRAFEQVFDIFTTTYFPTAIFALGTIAVLTHRNLYLGLGLVIWTVLFITVQIFMANWLQPLRVASSKADTAMTGILSDAVSNHSVVSLFASARHEESQFSNAVDTWRGALRRAWNADAIITAVQDFFALAIEVALLAGGVILWQRGVITIGDFVLIQVYVIGLVSRLWNIGNSTRRLYSAFADAHEMLTILNTPAGIKDIAGAQDLNVTEAGIDIRNISFNFDASQPILEKLDLSVRGGEKLALVGPSGAGKSTVTKLLLRFYDVSSGGIYIDGQNIAEVTQESLRRNIAFVPQEPILFHRSLMDNIRYGRQEATDEEVFEAARKARCHDFITALPEGYETHVGERGIKLSGGERQRVAIARAILKNAPILILDEATSALDSESEHLIQDALKILMEGKTVIVIAHRLSTIMTMDRIVVIEDGKIAAQGTHSELLDQTGGLYHKLWSIQAGSFLADEEPGQ